MSVKFEKETVREAPIPGGRKQTFVHEVGERLTGGESQKGYLAVRRTFALSIRIGSQADLRYATDIPQTASNKSASHKNADVWHIIGFARSSCILDCARP